MNTDKRCKVMTSVGSQMRRENERILQEHISGFMEEARDYIQKSQVVFLHAPGLNRTLFMSESKPLRD